MARYRRRRTTPLPPVPARPSVCDIRILGEARELDSFFGPRTESKQQRHYFASPERFAAWCATRNQADHWAQSAWTPNTKSDWNGAESMQATINLAFRGWPEGAARAARLRDKIVASTPQQSRFVGYAMAGAYPNVARFVAGNPMHMRSLDSARARRRPLITLLSDIGANANVDAHVFVNRAAVVAAVVDAIESRGFACGVVSYCIGSDGVTAWTCAVTVKETHTPADISRLAFGLGHPALLRRFMFASCTQDAFTAGLGSGYGSHRNNELTADAKRAQTYTLTQPQSAYFGSAQKAETLGLEYIVESLASQGCPAFREHKSFCAEGVDA